MLKDLGTPARGLVRAAGVPREVRRRRTVLVLIILACFTLIVLDARRSAGSPVEPLRTGAAAVFGPLESTASSARQPVDNLRDRFAELDRLQAENEKLKTDNDQLRQQLNTTDYTRNRAAELDRLLRLAPKFTMTPARVIGMGSAQSFSHTVTIDAGTADGVRVDQTVLNGSGLVGRVVRTTQGTSTVLLIGDRNSTVGGRLNSTMALGFVSGRGEVGGTLDYKLVDLKARPRAGDRIVTWGSSGNAPYVPGVPIGVVTSVTATAGALGSTAIIKPYVDPTRIDTVGVVTGPPARAPRGQLKPTTTAGKAG
ncbi:rod shape-determining protein MreC [Kribbella sandramycini]|uniref:Cell shape-determining protein MreC n=1 Tax=Kribbella sandramycini TaxID=60450 RepID=A0A7Y4KWT7_9ACTN|nr:rod shape-determining protein MreC [Kribbella sandramycini]MBB6567943.1 rod shape-determining protein MreC [Kribbella sandramycini]NOL39462.1 rod shape-determining protein MreC [Kribbella sandramycini]